jgi:hypothetical protein
MREPALKVRKEGRGGRKGGRGKRGETEGKKW